MVTVIKNDLIKITRLELGAWQTNSYSITCLKTQASVIIDAPAEGHRIIENLRGSKPKFLLLTHNHLDHTGALPEVLSRLKIPLAVHVSDSIGLACTPEILLQDGGEIVFGEARLEVLHTPGHTPGSLCFKTGKYLISGDTIFPGGPGRTERPSEFQQIVKSIVEKIIPLPDSTRIFPGHGKPTVLKKVKEEYAEFSSHEHDPLLYGDVTWLNS